MKDLSKKPNILFMLVDEERYPMGYESEELKEWRRKNLKTHERLRENGIHFSNHYIGSTACAPSRATLFTGQYPSLHGVTQTPGAAKGSFDSDMYWLDPNTVPTLGDYFRAAGYQTYWKGKWHLSDEDILIPGTRQALPSYDMKTGKPNRKYEQLYVHADRLDSYGFSGWNGPEPHGADPRNSGSSASSGVDGRDAVYAKDVVQLLKELEAKQAVNQADEHDPWLIVSSFVNPHDITLFGLFAQLSPNYDFHIDPTLPDIPPAPTASESLHTKPTAQQSYRETYHKALQPTFDSPLFRKLYYSLLKEVDQEMAKVLRALQQSIFYEDTIVVFTSDHGDLLGAHGGLFQKWHNAYEETVHVPFVIHNPKMFPSPQQTEILTSHVDVVPTLLSLANISVDQVQETLRNDHSEVHPFVGRDLSSFLLSGHDTAHKADDSLYFMTDDEFSRGLNQQSFLGKSYEAVSQPNHLETVITRLKTGDQQKEELWKLSRYFDHPQFWSNPHVEDQVETTKGSVPLSDNTTASIVVTTKKREPVPEQYELYNVTKDPYEKRNLAHPSFSTPKTRLIQQILIQTLEDQKRKKRRSPSSP